MKATELRERTTEDLEGLEKDLSRDLWKARLENYTNQLDDTAKIQSTRRDIARIKTILTERASAESDAS